MVRFVLFGVVGVCGCLWGCPCTVTLMAVKSICLYLCCQIIVDFVLCVVLLFMPGGLFRFISTCLWHMLLGPILYSKAVLVLGPQKLQLCVFDVCLLAEPA